MPASPLLLTDEELNDPAVRERFLRFVKVDEATGCHHWTGFITNLGYGRFNLPNPKRTRFAHRVAYRLFVGPIAPDMQVDHLCHTQDTACDKGNDCMHRRCVNPEHLGQATARENTLRGRTLAARQAAQTHCKRGHEFLPHLTYRGTHGARICFLCRAEDRARKREERAAQKAADQGLIVNTSYRSGGAS